VTGPPDPGTRTDLAPLYGLRLRTARLELRLPTRDELVELAAVARQGVHPPDEMPFLVTWTDNLRSPSFVEDFVGHHLELRSTWHPEAWSLELAVWADGEPIGVQGIRAESFRRERTAFSGSWLAQRHQGRGYGTEMRAAILELAFTGLGAAAAGSGALEGNLASARVSAKLGYEEAGERRPVRHGEPVRELRFMLTRERWEQIDRPSVEIVGLEPCLPLFGLSSGYSPRMPADRIEQLREWHERALAEGRREEPISVEHLGHLFVVPPEVYPPHPLGLAELVRAEVRPGERVLDLGTGSGVNGIVAAAAGGHVVAVDVNPIAVECARANVAANRLADRIDVRESDVFEAVDDRFDLVVFDPPFRWFAPRDLWERGTADENYEALRRFFAQVGGHLTSAGRILLSFGTTGDIDYLHELIDGAGLAVEELRRLEGERDGFPVAYVAYRLAPR
jgi:release factor glutamine methyltransferase